MTDVDETTIRHLFTNDFRQKLEGDWGAWRNRYRSHLEKIKVATRETWLQGSFQEKLWDDDAVANIGPGISVAVEGAYSDIALADSLFRAKEQGLKGSAPERGPILQALFESTLTAVQPYNKRRPKARLMRLLASLFPSDVSCIVDERRLWQLMRLLGISPVKGGFVAQHPLLREGLRGMLGDRESGGGDDVEQSMFTWFLWQKYCANPETGAVDVGPTKTVATDAPTLALLPATVQRKGLVHVRGNVPLLVAVVRESEQGISRADLVAAIQREAPHLQAQGSANNIISQAQGGLGLIQLSNGAYRPTVRGLELITNPDAAQVLQPLLIGRIFGVGHLLLALKDKPTGVAKKPLIEQLSTLIPNRTSLWSGNELINWAYSSKLATQEHDRVLLTEDGAAYADALPTNFGERWRLEATLVAERASDETDVADSPIAPRDTFVEAAWGNLQARFNDGPLSSQLILPDGLLAELHAALHAIGRKRFVLLSGLSGTGKTSIARCYAEAYCRALGLTDWQARYAQIAVRPDWTDPTGLLGFVNSIADPPVFQAAEAFHLVNRADADRARPFFLCLDEMNLARVEHYFAPFLSAMEGPAGRLTFHGEADAIDNVPPGIEWPENLFIFGTVNMDESTHPFSDKVLDRAFTFELWDIDLDEWEQRKRGNGISPLMLEAVAAHLRGLYAALSPARRHFGYRTADEVLSYCQAGASSLALDRLLDGATLMKVLPRVRGDDTGPLETALVALQAAAPANRFPKTAAKIERMRASLKATGQARFWA